MKASRAAMVLKEARAARRAKLVTASEAECISTSDTGLRYASGAQLICHESRERLGRGKRIMRSRCVGPGRNSPDLIYAGVIFSANSESCFGTQPRGNWRRDLGRP